MEQNLCSLHYALSSASHLWSRIAYPDRNENESSSPFPFPFFAYFLLTYHPFPPFPSSPFNAGGPGGVSPLEKVGNKDHYTWVLEHFGHQNRNRYETSEFPLEAWGPFVPSLVWEVTGGHSLELDIAWTYTEKTMKTNTFLYHIHMWSAKNIHSQKAASCDTMQTLSQLCSISKCSTTNITNALKPVAKFLHNTTNNSTC